MKRLLPLVLVLSGCVHMSKSVHMDRSDQPVPGEDVRVFAYSDDIPETCEPVADLHASASEELSSEKKVVDKLKKEAGKLGANAIRIQEAYSGGFGSLGSSSMLDSQSSREFDGEAFWCPAGSGEAGSASS
jgi:hypothetical protein